MGRRDGVTQLSGAVNRQSLGYRCDQYFIDIEFASSALCIVYTVLQNYAIPFLQELVLNVNQ